MLCMGRAHVPLSGPTTTRAGRRAASYTGPSSSLLPPSSPPSPPADPTSSSSCRSVVVGEPRYPLVPCTTLCKVGAGRYYRLLRGRYQEVEATARNHASPQPLLLLLLLSSSCALYGKYHDPSPWICTRFPRLFP